MPLAHRNVVCASRWPSQSLLQSRKKRSRPTKNRAAFIPKTSAIPQQVIHRRAESHPFPRTISTECAVLHCSMFHPVKSSWRNCGSTEQHEAAPVICSPLSRSTQSFIIAVARTNARIPAVLCQPCLEVPVAEDFTPQVLNPRLIPNKITPSKRKICVQTLVSPLPSSSRGPPVVGQALPADLRPSTVRPKNRAA